MHRVDTQSLALGLGAFALGVIVLITVESPLPRYLGGLTALAVGLGALRRGFRLD